MAARQLLRRFHSLLLNNQPQSSLRITEPSWQFFYSAKAIFSGNEFHRRNIQSQAEPTNQADEDVEKHETGNLKRNSRSENVASLASSSTDNPVVEYNVMSRLKPASSRHDLAMMFTCKVCETRSVKTCSRESYEKGVVIIRCGGCNNRHLIADRLGWFGEPGSVEDFLAAKGEEMKKGSHDTLSLTLEDLAGTDKISAN